MSKAKSAATTRRKSCSTALQLQLLRGDARVAMYNRYALTRLLRHTTEKTVRQVTHLELDVIHV